MTFLKTYLPFYKRNLKVAIPIVLSQLGGALVQLVDTFLVGHLGTVELAAVSFASAIFIIGMLGAMGMIMGLTPLVGMSFVRNEESRVSELFKNGFLLTLIMSVISCGLLLLIIPLMPYMGQEPEVIELCLPFYKLMILSLVPFLFFCTCKQFLEGLGNTSTAMIITIISNIINVILAYMLIFGKWGAPALGVVGAGIGTLIARLSMPILFFLFIRFKPAFWRYCQLFRMVTLNRKSFTELISIGTPIAGQMLLEIIAFSMAGIMAGWLGAKTLAGNQIASQISNMCFMIMLGIGAATTIRVSHQLGAGDLKAAQMASKASIHLCLVYNIISVPLLFIFRYNIVGLFTTDEAVIDIGATLLIFVAIFQISDGLQCVGAGILRGLTDVKVMMFYAFISYLCINIPIGYFLGFILELGASGIWIGFIFGLSVAAILFHRRAHKKFRELQLALDKS